MAPAEFKEARQKLGLSQAQLGRILNTAPQTIRKWEMGPDCSTSRPPNPIAVEAMRWFLDGFRPNTWPK